MHGGYEGKFAPLGEKQAEKQVRKRKKRADSDTSTPRSPHPHGAYDLSAFSPTSKSEFEKLDMDGKMNCLFDLMSKSGPLLMKIDSINQTLYHNRAIYDVTEARLRLLEYKSLDMETRMLRTNLVFSGIPEHSNSDESEAGSSLKAFLTEKLKLDPNSIGIVSAFRIGRRQVVRGRKPPRSIIATFSDVRYVNSVMENVKLLKGSSYGVSRDYPREIREARKEIWPEFKEARNKYGPRNVKLVFPAALVIHGETVRNMFPGWHDVLRGSRNSDVKARTELRLNTIIDVTLKTAASGIREESSSSEPDSSSDTEQHSAKTFPANQEKAPQDDRADVVITKPGYLLDKHPIMSENPNAFGKTTAPASGSSHGVHDPQPETDVSESVPGIPSNAHSSIDAS